MFDIAILAINHRDLVSTDVKKPTQTGHKNYRSCFDDRPRVGVVKHTLTHMQSGVNYYEPSQTERRLSRGGLNRHEFARRSTAAENIASRSLAETADGAIPPSQAHLMQAPCPFARPLTSRLPGVRIGSGPQADIANIAGMAGDLLTQRIQ